MRTRLASALAFLALAAPAARAQDPGLGMILGGYGATAGDGGGSMAGGSSAGAPMGPGKGVVVTSGGVGSGAALTFRPRPEAGMAASRRPPFTLGSMGGGMSGGMGQSFGRRPFVLRGTGSSGGMGGGGMAPMPVGRGMGVMPPSLGYPFRQPPRLTPAPTSGAGMSM